MPTVIFTPHLRNHLAVRDMHCDGETVARVLDTACQSHPRLRGYLFDEQGRMRKHVNLFVDGERIGWTDSLEVPVRGETEVYVLQALSGG